MWFLRVWYLTSSNACASVNARHGNTAASSVRAWGSVRAGVFFKPDPQAQQEVEREEYVEHVPVPRRPGAVLVLFHAALALPVLEGLRDRPAQGRGATARGQGGVGRRIREG